MSQDACHSGNTRLFFTQFPLQGVDSPERRVRTHVTQQFGNSASFVNPRFWRSRSKLTISSARDGFCSLRVVAFRLTSWPARNGLCLSIMLWLGVYECQQASPTWANSVSRLCCVSTLSWLLSFGLEASELVWLRGLLMLLSPRRLRLLIFRTIVQRPMLLKFQ